MKYTILNLEAFSPAVSSPDGFCRTLPVPKPTQRIESASREATPPHLGQILRFRRSERMLHWSIAVPFMLCWVTGFILKVFYNLHSEDPSRDVLSWIHRIGGAGLIVFPTLWALRNRSDYKIHLYNIKQAWTWASEDLKWLMLMGAAMVNSKVKLPDQGKFNAAEKLNFMMGMCTYPVFILTGILLWVRVFGFLSWIIHVSLALVATPFMLGHLYMALVNPDTRVGLGGMFSGYVDRHWAKHHYALWYRENFRGEETWTRSGTSHQTSEFGRLPSPGSERIPGSVPAQRQIYFVESFLPEK